MITILILSSILTVALGTAAVLNRSLKIAKISSDSSVAYLAAESGAEQILWQARYNNSYEIDPITFTISGLSVEVTSSDTANYVYATSTGDYLGLKRGIAVGFEKYD